MYEPDDGVIKKKLHPLYSSFVNLFSTWVYETKGKCRRHGNGIQLIYHQNGIWLISHPLRWQQYIPDSIGIYKPNKVIITND